MLGRNKSGCVGMVPINYIDIKVPLERSDNNLKENTNSPRVIKAKVLYDFIAEVADDLSITVILLSSLQIHIINLVNSRQMKLSLYIIV